MRIDFGVRYVRKREKEVVVEGLSLMDKISGVVENVVYRNESNDYTVFEIKKKMTFF